MGGNICNSETTDNMAERALGVTEHFFSGEEYS